MTTTRPADVGMAQAERLLDRADQLLDQHDESIGTPAAGAAWNECRATIASARALLLANSAISSQLLLARWCYRAGVAASVGYWQAISPDAALYGIEDRNQLRDEAIALLRQVTATSDDNPTDHMEASGRLAVLLYDRHLAAGSQGPSEVDGTDLAEAVAAFHAGIWWIADADPSILSTYADAVCERARHDPGTEDLDIAVVHLESLIQTASELEATGEIEPAEALELGSLLRRPLVTCLLAQEGPDAVETALGHLHTLADDVPHDDPARLFNAASLVDAYERRGGGLPQRADREAHRVAAREVYELARGTPDHRLAAAMLGAALVNGIVREAASPLDDAGEAIAVLREALAGPDDVLAESWRSRAHLGELLATLHQREPSRYHSDDGIHELEVALRECPLDSPARDSLVARLVQARLDVSGGVDDAGLDATISVLDAAGNGAGDQVGSVELLLARADVLGRRYQLTRSTEDLNAAMRQLAALGGRSGVGATSRVVFLQNLGTRLYERYLDSNDERDLDASSAYMAAASELTDDPDFDEDELQTGSTSRFQLVRNIAEMQFYRAMARGDVERAGQAVARLEQLRARLTETMADDFELEISAGTMRSYFSFLGGSTEDGLEGMGQAVDALESVPSDHPRRPRLLAQVGAALLARSLRPFQASSVEAAEMMLREARERTTPGDHEWVGTGSLLAHALQHHYLALGRDDLLDEAIRTADETHEQLALRAAKPLTVHVSRVLAECLRARDSPGDRDRARRAGATSLRESVAVTLLQPDAGQALENARTAASHARRLAWWNLGDGDVEGAVEVLELGRGLVLHAATQVRDVPGLLKQAGHHDLARQWPMRSELPDTSSLPVGAEILGSKGAEPEIPDDLRRRALAALLATTAGEGLTSAPSSDQTAHALRKVGARAVVYLLPPGDADGKDIGRSGAALVVTDGGKAEHIELGLLQKAKLERWTLPYQAAHRARQALIVAGRAHDADEEWRDAHDRWRGALDELCDWAGPAVMNPLLRHLGRATEAPPRIVLVPLGMMSAVPWHAATLSSGLRSGGRPVRAVQRATISYAASARQFIGSALRTRLPVGLSPVIVGDPEGVLEGAASEAKHIFATFYPDGRLLGRVRRAHGRGTPAEVLDAVPGEGRPGASILHLACHAMPGGTSPLDSYLRLAPSAGAEEGSGLLTVRTVLEHAETRPADGQGGLVLLDACVTDFTATDTDEALTLSSAFLAAGAAGVAGSRWEVHDGTAALLMYLVHERLAAGIEPAEALRSAQLWLLDPDRQVPDIMPPEIADLLNDADPTALDLWAAYTYQGH